MKKVLHNSSPANEKNAVIRKFSDISAKKRRKLLLGSLMVKLFPSRAHRLEQNKITNYWGSFDRLLRNGLEANAYRDKDFSRMRRLFSHYWSQEADRVEHVWQNRFEQEFLGHNIEIIRALERQIKGAGFNYLYEIGCGHGQVLDYLANRFNDIEMFVGIDISSTQIEKNKAQLTHPKLSFHAADAAEWIIDNAEGKSIFLTNGGVFEYFLQDELEKIFKHIAENLAPACFAIVETIGADHNLETETDSMLYGREMAFSHNYPVLMQQAGFEILHHSEQIGTDEHGSGRWVRVLGEVR